MIQEVVAYAAQLPQGELVPWRYALPSRLKAYEVIIQVSHCGLCHTDLYMIDNDWNRSSYPLVPGHEVVGCVVAKGAGCSFDIGDRVGVSWVKRSCLECIECLRGDTNICQKKEGIYGSGSFGGFASHIVADSRFIYPIPGRLSSSDAAPLLCAGATVYSPLRTLRSDQAVAIIGVGGLGHLALQFADKKGCDVTAISSTQEKREDALALGADRFCLGLDESMVCGFDLILVTSDADLDWNLALRCLKPRGTLCFVSRPPKGMKFDFAYLVSTERRIIGSNNAHRASMGEMLQESVRLQVKPWVELRPMASLNAAILKLRQGQVRYRIVLEK
jgi:uncharacterized zinc-type alcohol dehydrogenase-like protein